MGISNNAYIHWECPGPSRDDFSMWHGSTSPPAPSSTLQVTEQDLCLSLRGPCSPWKQMPITQFSWFQPFSVQSDPAPIFSPSLAHSFLYLKGHFFLFIIKILIEFDSDKHAMYALMSYSILTREHGISCILHYQYSNKLPIKPCYKKIEFSLKSTGLVYYCRNHIREDIIAILPQHKPDSTS